MTQNGQNKSISVTTPTPDESLFSSCECQSTPFLDNQSSPVIRCLSANATSQQRSVDDSLYLCIWANNPTTQIQTVEEVVLRVGGSSEDYFPVDNGMPDIFTQVYMGPDKGKALVAIILDRSWFPSGGATLSVANVLVEPVGSQASTQQAIHDSVNSSGMAESRLTQDVGGRRHMQQANGNDASTVPKADNQTSSRSGAIMLQAAAGASVFYFLLVNLIHRVTCCKCWSLDKCKRAFLVTETQRRVAPMRANQSNDMDSTCSDLVSTTATVGGDEPVSSRTLATMTPIAFAGAEDQQAASGPERGRIGRKADQSSFTSRLPKSNGLSAITASESIKSLKRGWPLATVEEEGAAVGEV